MSASTSEPLRVLSWNVNGLRSVHRKGFGRWRARTRATIIGVQGVDLDLSILR